MSRIIAVCIICKNEEALLARCLESVKDIGPIYILDTGSSDNTINIARQYTENVFLDFIWVDDFSLAQNFLLEKVRGKSDFVLSIDSDEQLISSPQEVQEAIELAKDVVRVTMISEHDKNEFAFGRIFRNTPDIFWQQAVHKHLNIPGEGEEVGNVRIMYGYSPAHTQDPDRALRMLEATVKAETNPVRNLFYLGREYHYKQKYFEAIDVLSRYLSVSNWDAEKAEAYLLIAQCYLELEKIEECAMAVLSAIKINSNFKEAIQFMAMIATKENKLQWERMARSANNKGLIWARTQVDRPNDVIAIFPHNDDESLFMAFILIRVKPLVIIVTDSFIQPERGDLGCTAEIRRQETINAMAIAGCPVVFLGIKDTELTEEILRDRLKHFNPTTIYIPALQGGNAQHDIVNKVGLELFGERCEQYCTYTKTELHTKGDREIKPTTSELELKEKMLNCYESQLNLRSTIPHFLAVKGESEWLIDSPKLKRVILTPWFGPLPEWFDKFEAPEGYTWILDQDIESFKKRVKDKLGIDYPGLPGTGKVHDYRCALGLLYEEEIKGFDFWATMDFDMVFGEVNKWFDDKTLNELDVWSNHHTYVSGPWTLYRNSEKVNKLFQENPHWKQFLEDQKPLGWVEREFSMTLEQSGLRYKYSHIQGDPYNPPFNLKKEKGKLYQEFNSEYGEVPMFHFRHSKQWPL